MGEPGPPYTPRYETRRIALWAVSRPASTAFERNFIERGDAVVLHEPFAYAYYCGPDRRSDRFADAEPVAEDAYDAVRARILDVDEASARPPPPPAATPPSRTGLKAPWAP